MRAKELSAEFGIAGVLDFREAESGLVKAAIRGTEGYFSNLRITPR